MKPSRLLALTLACAAAGLAGGFAARKGRPSAAGGSSLSGGSTASGVVSRFAAASSESSRPAPPPLPQSTDTVATLAALDPAALYPRLALWLRGASAEDLGAWWQVVGGSDPANEALCLLVMIRWTRLAPQAALAAAAGKPAWVSAAWQAWACNDPAAALAAAAPDEARLTGVVEALGRFQPAWLREHFHEIPGDAKVIAVYQAAERPDREDPVAALDFMRGFNGRIDAHSFSALIERDPWAALDWLRKNPALAAPEPGVAGGGGLATFAAQMADSDPETLRRIADSLPPGEMRRSLEAGLFNSLVQSDPAAALEMARNTPGEHVAKERLAAVGLALAEKSPDAAFEVVASILRRDSPAPDGGTSTAGDWDSILGGDDRIGGMSQLVEALFAVNPGRLLDMHPLPEPDNFFPAINSFPWFAHRFSSLDPQGFEAWVTGHPDPAVREAALPVLGSQYINSGNFVSAVDLSRQSPSGSRDIELSRILSAWDRADPAASRQWLETADLPPALRASLRKNLQH